MATKIIILEHKDCPQPKNAISLKLSNFQLRKPPIHSPSPNQLLPTLSFRLPQTHYRISTKKIHQSTAPLLTNSYLLSSSGCPKPTTEFQLRKIWQNRLWNFRKNNTILLDESPSGTPLASHKRKLGSGAAPLPHDPVRPLLGQDQIWCGFFLGQGLSKTAPPPAGGLDTGMAMNPIMGPLLLSQEDSWVWSCPTAPRPRPPPPWPLVCGFFAWPRIERDGPPSCKGS